MIAMIIIIMIVLCIEQLQLLKIIAMKKVDFGVMKMRMKSVMRNLTWKTGMIMMTKGMRVEGGNIMRERRFLRSRLEYEMRWMGGTWRDISRGNIWISRAKRGGRGRMIRRRRQVKGYQEEPIPRPWICKWASLCAGHAPALWCSCSSCAFFRSRHRSPCLLLHTLQQGRMWYRRR